MFGSLFANTGLSLDRLRALVEVGASGSIAVAAGGDPVKQSQYSRQIKELEDFFQTKLIERYGKGIRLTSGGKELARISRFFLLGLSNFRRGCLAEEQMFRIGASATFIQQFLLPVLSELPSGKAGPRYTVEIASDDEIERRLHELTLDFGVVTNATLSRPLQLKLLGSWRLGLWVPKTVCRNEARALQAVKDKRLPFVLPACEIALSNLDCLKGFKPRLTCSSFLEARAALERNELAALLPDFLPPDTTKAGALIHMRLPALMSHRFQYHLAWNPRLLRLNPHASRRRDFLQDSLAKRMREQEGMSKVSDPV